VATLPRAATRRWGAGVASITGPVRKENQDAAIVFEVESTAVLIVADGLGGLPHGQEAARVAVGAAALSAAEVLGGFPGPTAHPELVAEQALLESAAALCRQARSSGWTETRDGFRSTLICVVATPTTYGFCYLGDGGGVVVRQTGAIDAFLVPQKADGIANVVAGSLGPVIHGTPVVGKLPRQGGDNLFIGTDGVFDRVPDGFAASVVRLLGSHDGDAQAVASLVVSDFASAKDGSLFVCDDNMSIAILCTPAPRPATAAATVQRPHAVRR
jgi:serine/threonine protein phosphatase PrpC